MKRKLKSEGKSNMAYAVRKSAWDLGKETVPVTARKSLNWLGITFFILLMAYPVFVQYVPLGIRQYLSATFR
jgi:hypothetical protein